MATHKRNVPSLPRLVLRGLGTQCGCHFKAPPPQGKDIERNLAIISSAAAADGFCVVLLLWQQHRLLLSLFAISVLLLFPLPTLRLFPLSPPMSKKQTIQARQERGDSKSKENAKSSRVGLDEDIEVK